MTKSKKIIIALVIIIVVVVLGIWLLWPYGGGIYGCGDDGGYLCDRSCQIDDDCIYSCGCGAINKDETCYVDQVLDRNNEKVDIEQISDCLGGKVRCNNDFCVTIESY